MLATPNFQTVCLSIVLYSIAGFSNFFSLVFFLFSQKRKFKDLEKEHSIKINYGAEGIRLIGDRDETSKAMPKVYEIIMSAMNSEKETRELELFAKNVCAFYYFVKYTIFKNGTSDSEY